MGLDLDEKSISTRIVVDLDPVGSGTFLPNGIQIWINHFRIRKDE